MCTPLLVFADASAIQTDDKAIATGKGVVYGGLLVLDGTYSVTVSIYDGTSNAGTALIPPLIFTTSSTSRNAYFSLDPPEGFKTGLYVDVTTTGSVSYIIYYESK